MEKAIMSEHWIANNLVSVVVAIIAAMTPIVTVWAQRYFAKKDKTPHSVSKAVIKNRKVELLCEELLTKLDATRVNVWLFHNGGYYYTGEAIQKLSMVSERNAEGVESIMHLFQNQPISIFQRNLQKLIANDWFREYNELQYNDSLSVLNKLYEIVSSGLFKLRNKEGYFCGILAIGYNNQHEVTTGEVEITMSIVKKVEMELTNVKGN